MSVTRDNPNRLDSPQDMDTGGSTILESFVSLATRSSLADGETKVLPLVLAAP
jgi:hypothetical protein